MGASCLCSLGLGGFFLELSLISWLPRRYACDGAAFGPRRGLSPRNWNAERFTVTDPTNGNAPVSGVGLSISGDGQFYVSYSGSTATDANGNAVLEFEPNPLNAIPDGTYFSVTIAVFGSGGFGGADLDFGSDQPRPNSPTSRLLPTLPRSSRIPEPSMSNNNLAIAVLLACIGVSAGVSGQATRPAAHGSSTDSPRYTVFIGGAYFRQKSATEIRQLLTSRFLASSPWHRKLIFPRQVTCVESSSCPCAEDGRGAATGDCAIGFLGNGRFVVADRQHNIRVFSTDTGNFLLGFGHPLADRGIRRRVVASGDGRYLMILPDSGPEIWDSRDGSVVCKLPRTPDGYRLAQFEGGRRFLVTYHPDGLNDLQRWDIDAVAGRANQIAAATADGDHEELWRTGDYLLLKGKSRSEAFAAGTLENLHIQRKRSDEMLAYIAPAGNAAWEMVLAKRRATVPRSPGDEDSIEFVSRTFPGGTEKRHWTIGAGIRLGMGRDDQRWTSFVVSPYRNMIAITHSYGKGVVFKKFPEGGAPLVVQNDPAGPKAFAIFVDEDRAILLTGGDAMLQSITKPYTPSMSFIPEYDPAMIVSPDRRRLLVRRRVVPDGGRTTDGADFSQLEGIALWELEGSELKR